MFAASFTFTVTSSWARWRHKSPPSRLFAQPFIQVQIKENIKDPCYRSLWGESTGDLWIPLTKDQLRGKCFHLMTSSCTIIIFNSSSPVYVYKCMKIVSIGPLGINFSESINIQDTSLNKKHLEWRLKNIVLFVNVLMCWEILTSTFAINSLEYFHNNSLLKRLRHIFYTPIFSRISHTLHTVNLRPLEVLVYFELVWRPH